MMDLTSSPDPAMLQALFDMVNGPAPVTADAPPPPAPPMPSTPGTIPSGPSPDLASMLKWLIDHLIQPHQPGGDVSDPANLAAERARVVKDYGKSGASPNQVSASDGGMTADVLARMAGRAPTPYQQGNPGGALPADELLRQLTEPPIVPTRLGPQLVGGTSWPLSPPASPVDLPSPVGAVPPPSLAAPARAGGPLGIDPAQLQRERAQVTADYAAKTQAANTPPTPAVKPPTIGLPNPQKPGFDWRSLIEMAGPIIGGLSIGDPASRNGFMNGWMHGQGLAKQEQEQRDKEAEKKAQASADYLLKIGEHASNITDPTEFEKFIRLADTAYAKSGYGQPGEVRDQVTLSPTKVAEAKRKEINEKLDGLEKGDASHPGYNLDELAQSAASITLKDGTKMSVGTAMDVTNRRPRLPSGVNVPKPTQASGTMDERAAKLQTQIRAAKTAGNTSQATTLQAEYDDLVKAKTDLNAAGRAPVDENVAAMRELQMELARQRLAEGNKKAAGLSDDGSDYAATMLRVTGKMLPLGNGGQAIKTAIINKAAEQTKLLGQSPVQSIQKQAAYKADAAALSKMTSMSASAESFETKALAQAEIVSSLSQKVSRTQYPIINKALLAGEAQILGDQDTQLLFNALTTFTTEYAKIMEGSTGSASGSTESARATAANLISASLNKGTLQATLDLMKREMALTIDGYRATIDHITGNMGGVVTTPTPTTAKPPVGTPYQEYLRQRGGK